MVFAEFPEVVNFKKIFEHGDDPTKWPNLIEHKGKKVFQFDRFPIENKERLLFSIEKSNSRYPQGFCIGVRNGYIKVDGMTSSGFRKHTNHLFWEDTEILDPKRIEVQVFSKENHIIIKNTWEMKVYEEHRTDGTKAALESNKVVRFPEGKTVSCFVGSSQYTMGMCNGAAMYSEEIPNGKRYFCNDGDEDDDFDDLIFTVTRVGLGKPKS